METSNILTMTISESDIYAKPSADIDEEVVQYDDVLRSLLVKYAPENIVKVAIKDNRQWMNKTIAGGK